MQKPVNMPVAVAQINTIIADFSHNAQKIIDTTEAAKRAGGRMVVFPELAICGYPPMDLCHAPWFLQNSEQALQQLLRLLPSGIAVVVGGIDRSPYSQGKLVQNVVFIIENGTVLLRQAKTLLPNYDVFDESRFFEPARQHASCELDGYRIAVGICEDIWGTLRSEYAHDPLTGIAALTPDLLIVPSASPFTMEKLPQRMTAVQDSAERLQVPVIYVNSVGGNDTLVFDGRSIVCRPDGSFLHLSSSFTEELSMVELTGTKTMTPPKQERWESLLQALILGLRDYVTKTGFSSVHLGLSGGIDSALVAYLARAALGKDRVSGIIMPSQYSSKESVTDAQALAANLSITTRIIPIAPLYAVFQKSLAASEQISLTWENIQSRIRGILLMAHANETGSLLLNTGNKSELSVGYCTLYGDMAGALAVIGDLFKTEVYALCRHINATDPIIPPAILEKAPSAELRPDQKDVDSLPDYATLDGILRLFLLDRADAAQIIAAGYPEEEVQRTLSLVMHAEFKRFQAPPVIKLSDISFGSSRRIPIAMHPSVLQDT